MKESPAPWAAPIGRLLLAGIFLMSGVYKLQNWPATAQAIAEKGLPAPDAFLSVAVGLELVGGILVALGLYARWGALTLLAFLVGVTVIMHNFWALPEGPQRSAQMADFMKNCALAGAMLFMLAVGAGPMSIDRWRTKRPAVPTNAG
jgi:putative oxidoreductase